MSKEKNANNENTTTDTNFIQSIWMDVCVWHRKWNCCVAANIKSTKQYWNRTQARNKNRNECPKQTFFWLVFVAIIEFVICSTLVYVSALHTQHEIPFTERKREICSFIGCIITKIKLFDENLKSDTFECQKQTNYNVKRLMSILIMIHFECFTHVSTPVFFFKLFRVHSTFFIAFFVQVFNCQRFALAMRDLLYSLLFQTDPIGMGIN